MKRTIFGTDGVRGRANVPPITAEVALRLGLSAGQYFRSSLGTKRVVIGKDTRRSGYMLENAMTAGFTSVGMNVFLLGPLPTPAIGMLTKSMRADLGVMISASHNPFYDNGIKFFGPDGFKLSDEDELKIEELYREELPLVSSESIGRASRISDGLGRYIEAVKTTLDPSFTLDGYKIVIDCANGASYKAAPEVLWELGAEVIEIGNNPNGYNINLNCGSMNPETAAETVLREKAHLGICLDGDADRVVLIDENGLEVNGDQLMALIASFWKQSDRLRGNGLVATVMSNLGFERYLNEIGLHLKRTPVGDRYVVEEMRRSNYNLGGEQSGHIVMTDFMTTGDGLVAALQFLEALVFYEKPATELLNKFLPYPQVIKNIKYSGDTDLLEKDSIKKIIADSSERLRNDGRLLIRKSGTEPFIRIMAEHHDPDLIKEIVQIISHAMES
ncbi:MAG: phosphoglucosamine mutase [Paracoccaceae bacterium]|nr:phosphoglucosamine mutase [Paracoccaceae bacterium]